MTVTCNQTNCFYNASNFCSRECLTLKILPNSLGVAVCDLFVLRNNNQEKTKQNLIIEEAENIVLVEGEGENKNGREETTEE